MWWPHISAVISGGRCITFWRELLSRMEVSGEEIVGVGADGDLGPVRIR